MTPRTRLAAGATALLLCGQYLVAEAIAAAAWTRPYSYSRNFISDLGITQCVDKGPCSPLGAVMNAGFVLSGLLAVLAATLLARLLKPGAAWLVIGLAVVHGAGSVTVGLVHSAPGTAAGTPHLHVWGAYAAILGGNLALIAAGLAIRRPWAAAWFRALSVGMGVLGLASGAALVATRVLPQGLLERGAVDSITLWEVATGCVLAFSLGRRTRSRSSVVSRHA